MSLKMDFHLPSSCVLFCALNVSFLRGHVLFLSGYHFVPSSSVYFLFLLQFHVLKINVHLISSQICYLLHSFNNFCLSTTSSLSVQFSIQLEAISITTRLINPFSAVLLQRCCHSDKLYYMNGKQRNIVSKTFLNNSSMKFIFSDLICQPCDVRWFILFQSNPK